MVAIDSESDSLHHFPEKVCLIQVGTAEGEVFLVDPLALRDLAPLAPVLADPNVVTVLHGAAYDLASMKRDFAFEIRGLFDSMVAAQFLGLPEVGLAALLKGILGIESGESRQKDDWAVRPLSAAQEHYAAEDVRHLFPLRARLMDSLAACGRAGWVEEECQALEGTAAADRVFHPDDCLAIKGVRLLDRRGLGILRELFVSREAWAHERGRPPFKVLGNETLLVWRRRGRRRGTPWPGSRAARRPWWRDTGTGSCTRWRGVWPRLRRTSRSWGGPPNPAWRRPSSGASPPCWRGGRTRRPAWAWIRASCCRGD
jgi:ribonuclease D